MEVDAPESPVVERPESSNSGIPVSRDRSLPPKPAVINAEVRAQQTVPPSISTNSSHAQPISNGKAHGTSAERPQVRPSRAQDVFDLEDGKMVTEPSADTKPVLGAPLNASNSVDSHASTSSNQLEGHTNTSAFSAVHAQQPPLPKLTKKQQRLLRKTQRVATKAASTSFDNQAVSIPNGSIRTTSNPATPMSANISSTGNENTMEFRDPSLDLRAGFWTESVCLECVRPSRITRLKLCASYRETNTHL